MRDATRVANQSGEGDFHVGCGQEETDNGVARRFAFLAIARPKNPVNDTPVGLAELFTITTPRGYRTRAYIVAEHNEVVAGDDVVYCRGFAHLGKAHEGLLYPD